MNNWICVEKSQDGAYDFMELVHGFHDFRIEKITFDAKQDTCIIFLKYDTGSDGVIMQCSTLYGFGFHPVTGYGIDYECDWLYSSDMRWDANKKTFIWCSNDDFFNDDDFRQETTWFESENVKFAYCDGEGIIQDIPEVFKRKCVCVESFPTLGFEKDCEYSWRITERGYSVKKETGDFHDFNNMVFFKHFKEKGEHTDFRGVF